MLKLFGETKIIKLTLRTYVVLTGLAFIFLVVGCGIILFTLLTSTFGKYVQDVYGFMRFIIFPSMIGAILLFAAYIVIDILDKSKMNYQSIISFTILVLLTAVTYLLTNNVTSNESMSILNSFQ